jgi:uncharacterized membrane protein
MTKNWQWIVAIILALATWIGSAVIYQQLPERIPTHWNARGVIDGYGSKQWAVFLVPAMMAGFMILWKFLPALSPKHFEVDTFRTTYLYILVVLMGMFAYLHAITLYAAWAHVTNRHNHFDLLRSMLGGMFVFFALLGNVMGKVKRNFYIGVRVPWTLASDRVWNDTHRIAAWMMVGGSIVGFLIVISSLRQEVALIAATVVLLVSFMSPIPYSFILYKRLERRGELGETA